MPLARTDAGLHRRRGAHAGARHRRDDRDLQRRARRPDEAASLPRSVAAGEHLGRSRCREPVAARGDAARLPGLPSARHAVRSVRRGHGTAGRRRDGRARRRERARDRAGQRDPRHGELLFALRRRSGRRPALHGRGRDDRRASGRDPLAPTLEAEVRGGPIDRRPHDSPRQRRPHGRRRPAGDVPAAAARRGVSRHRRGDLEAAALQLRARAPEELHELHRVRPIEARGGVRSGAGGDGRHRTSTAPGARRPRVLRHADPGRRAPGRHRQARQARARRAPRRRGVRAADCMRQRRAPPPRARDRAAARDGAASRAGRQGRTAASTTGNRERRACVCGRRSADSCWLRPESGCSGT